MAKVYLIRHCESEGNACRRTQAQVDALVTAKGYAQVEALRKRFRDIPVDAVYSSETYRALATAEPIAADHGLRTHVRISLREITTGVWEDMAWGNIAEEYPEAHDIWESSPWENITPGAGTFTQSAERGIYCIRRMAKEVGENGTAVAVSHSVTIKATLCSVLGLPMDRVGEIGHAENTAVSLLEVDKAGNISLIYKNDAEHLPPELRRAWTGVAGRDINMAIYPVRTPEQEEAYLELAAMDAAERGKPFDSGERAASARALLAAQPNYLALCYLKKRPVGFIEMAAKPGLYPECGWIEKMYVLPELQSRGYGEQLFGYAAYELRYADIFKVAMGGELSPEERRIMERFMFRPEAGADDVWSLELACPPCVYPIIS